MFAPTQDIESFIREFEARSLPKPRWTHHAHLIVGLWYLTHHSPDDALSIIRQRIRAYNEAVGTANTDSSGYHETLTRLFLRGIAAHILAHSNESLPSSLALLLQSPLAHEDWPLSFYSRERLFSVAARHDWLEPDLTPNDNTRTSPMKTKHLPQHPRIASSDLARLTLDNASARRFAGRFQPTLLGGILLGCVCLLVGYLLYRAGALSTWATGAVMAGGVLPGLAIAFIAHRRMLRATPLSVQSGQPMFPFVLQDREQIDSVEIAYIDESSGTYFTRLYVA